MELNNLCIDIYNAHLMERLSFLGLLSIFKQQNFIFLLQDFFQS